MKGIRKNSWWAFVGGGYNIFICNLYEYYKIIWTRYIIYDKLWHVINAIHDWRGMGEIIGDMKSTKERKQN